jgi:carbamate kinase
VTARKEPARSDRPTLVIALGGNALARAGDPPTAEAQLERARQTCDLLLPVIASGRWRVVITHGNGPQVGSALLRSDLAAEADELPRVPIDAAVAETQGSMGYMIQQCLSNALWEADLRRPVVTVVTQVIVDEDDPAFTRPAKPIGRSYPAGSAESLQHHDWTLKEQPDGSFRRVVPSPLPKEIVEQDAIRDLVAEGAIVICCGGGGIPVVTTPSGGLRGIEAVVDKDHASSLLAVHLGAEVLALLTSVPAVVLGFGGAGERPLGEVDAATMRRHEAEGHFPPGSMGPKVRASIDFLERGGARAVITDPVRFEHALEGRAGTRIVAG